MNSLQLYVEKSHIALYHENNMPEYGMIHLPTVHRLVFCIANLGSKRVWG